MIFVRLTVVSAAALMTAALPAHAGFQFSAPTSQPQAVQQAPAALPSAPIDAPMPIVPAPAVEEIALSPMPDTASVRAAQASALVINPYPLQQGAAATHDTGGAASLDQAMMEGTGNLRPVATPGGNNNNGRIARATITSRFDGNSQRPQAKPLAQQMDYASSLTPIPGDEVAALHHDVASVQARPVIEAQPLMPRPAPTLPPATAPAQPGQFVEAVGFGRDLPLALALTQVVPADYSFSFSPSIDAGTTVSWQGGKPWNVVLNDMLAAHGLTAVISGKQVTIQAAA